MSSSFSSSARDVEASGTLSPNQSAANALPINHETNSYGNRRTVPLKVALPGFLGLVFAAIGVAVTLVWITSQSTLRSESIGAAQTTILDMANTLLKTTDASIMAQVGQFFADVQAQVDLTARLQNGTSPTLRRGHLDDYYWYFYDTILENPHMTGFTYVDLENGAYLSFDRTDSGLFQYELMLNTTATCNVCNYPGGATPPNTKLYFPVADDGTPSSVNSSYSPNYHPWGRPWFQQAVAAGTAVWTGFSAHSTGGVGGVGCARPYYNAVTGAVSGVLMVDILLTPLSTFLTDIVSSTGGYAYIIDPNGGLVATSTGEPTAKVVAGQAVQVMAAQSTDAFTRSSEAVAVAQTNGSSIQTGDMYWFGIQTFVDQPGKATFHGNIVAGREAVYYTGAVTTMTTQFDNFLHRAVTNSAVITVAFIIGGFGSIVLFVYYLILKPLNVVRNSMVKATKFDFSDLKDRQDASDASALSEINALQFVFRAMITSFAKALQSNKSLRSPVIASTSRTGRT
ncbi:hypothetical protein HDU87_004943 [Geranomyces variabilis]|uniref:Cache domain-containing protein n=1 Tax=Geranomyces variabilis TaxID=109894 RepID=A0AAD5XPI2_9FUNG|nr:hypothetical protein HDU87_004943 [Geranomyces variabilis]